MGKEITNHVVAIVGIAGLLLAAPPARAADLKSPDKVKVALRLMVQVSNDMKRQIGNKNFARVPHENQEFVEAAGGLRTAVAEEPAAFKRNVDTKLNAAVKAAQDVADLSGKTTDVDKLMAEHAKVVAAMNAVFDLFPADLRPDPNAPPPGRRGRG